MNRNAGPYGMLYLVATPIGNLEDITLRALRILREVDLVAAEDTRASRNLLNHFAIQKPLTSYYEHNKVIKGPVLLQKLKEGQNIALISDAGMPGISDPGSDLVKEALAAGILVTVIPGANAMLTALVGSGLDTARFAFEGFLPREKSARRKQLLSLQDETRTLVFYEAPHRLLAVLRDMSEIFGEREMAAGRELTKLYEETVRGTIGQVLAHFEENPPRGEFTLVVAGGRMRTSQKPDEPELLSQLQHLMTDGQSRKQAAKILAQKYDMPAKTIYDLGIKP